MRFRTGGRRKLNTNSQEVNIKKSNLITKNDHYLILLAKNILMIKFLEKWNWKILNLGLINLCLSGGDSDTSFDRFYSKDISVFKYEIRVS